MDKRLIDADKLLEWIKENKWHYFDSPEVLEAIEDMVESGGFDPDPIPPTIKQGDKVKHPEILEPVTVISIGEEWTVVQDYLGYRYDVRFSDLEVSHD